MLNITRVHNSISAVSGQRRILALAHDYAKRRFAFGSLVEKKPLWVETVTELEFR
jgi:acyl-CoA dehydrogenase